MIWERKLKELGDEIMISKPSDGELVESPGSDLGAWGVTGNNCRAWGMIWKHKLNILVNKLII